MSSDSSPSEYPDDFEEPFPSASPPTQKISQNPSQKTIPMPSHSHADVSTTLPLPVPVSLPPSSSIGNALRGSPAYQIAWELEQWKRQEKSKFSLEMRQLKSSMLKSLEDEFRRAEIEREKFSSQKSSELSAVEKKLSAALVDVERQKATLKAKENEISNKSHILQMEIQRAAEESELAIKRVKEQFAHQLALFKSKEAALQSTVDSLKGEVSSWTAKYKDIELQFQTFRTKISRSPLGDLRLEISAKSKEIEFLRREIQAEGEEKIRMADRMAKCIGEIAKLKRQMEEKERALIDIEREDLQRQRIAYLHKVNSVGLRRDAEALREIQSEIHKIKENSQGTKEIPPTENSQNATIPFDLPSSTDKYFAIFASQTKGQTMENTKNQKHSEHSESSQSQLHSHSPSPSPPPSLFSASLDEERIRKEIQRKPPTPLGPQRNQRENSRISQHSQRTPQTFPPQQNEENEGNDEGDNEEGEEDGEDAEESADGENPTETADPSEGKYFTERAVHPIPHVPSVPSVSPSFSHSPLSSPPDTNRSANSTRPVRRGTAGTGAAAARQARIQRENKGKEERERRLRI